MKILAVILSYKRIPNIERIVDSIKSSEFQVNEIVVFNNTPGVPLEFGGVTVINSSRNLFCFPRYAIAQVFDATHYLSLDDDIVIQPKTIGNFVEWSKKLPEAVLGHFGMVLDRDSGKPYSEGSRVSTGKIKEAVPVGAVLGRVHFCRMEKLAQMFAFRNRIPNFNEKSYVRNEGEDILLCLANQHHGHKNYVIPTGAGMRTENLPDVGVNLRTRGKHMSQRDKATVDCLEVAGGFVDLDD